MKTPFATALFVATALFTFPVLAADGEPAASAAAPAAEAAAPTEPAKPSLEPAYAKDAPVVKVNGETITYTDVQNVWNNLFSGNNPPEFASFDEKVRLNVLRGMVSERLVYNEAVKAKYPEKKEVQQRLDDLKKQVVMQSFMEDKAKEMVSESDIKDLYNKKAKEAKDQYEVKARHILLSSEDEAKAIVAELKKGGDFEKIAKEKSTDKGSGASGGDLGWFGKERMVPEFADAAFKLKKGETSEPVKTPFGWHIIKVDDRRPVKFASYDELKESLQSEAANKKVQEYLESLLKKSDIAYFAPNGEKKPFPAVAPAAGGNN